MTKKLEISERILGCMIGAAAGDALGYPVEFLSLTGILDRTGGDPFWTEQEGRVSDDTQLSLVVADALVKTRPTSADGAALARFYDAYVPLFVDWSGNPPGGHRAPGGACLRGAAVLASGVSPPALAGALDALGSGAVMRAHPVALAIPDLGAAQLFADAQGVVSHRHPRSMAAVRVYVAVLSYALNGGNPKRLVRDVIEPIKVTKVEAADFLWDLLEPLRRISAATPLTSSTVEEILEANQGWRGDEALVAALAVFLSAVLSGAEPYEAIYRSVVTSGDSDTVGSLVGALVGAFYGFDALPDHLTEGLEFEGRIRQLAADLYLTRLAWES